MVDETKVEELLQAILEQLRAIHQHVGPTCADFMDENAQNGNKPVERLTE